MKQCTVCGRLKYRSSFQGGGTVCRTCADWKTCTSCGKVKHRVKSFDEGSDTCHSCFTVCGPTLPPGWPKKLTCLGCERMRKARHPGDRLCRKCRRLAADNAGALQEMEVVVSRRTNPVPEAA